MIVHDGFFSSAAGINLFTCREANVVSSTPLWGVTLPCQHGPAGERSLHGLAVVSGSSWTHLQRLRVQLLLRERGEEMTFTQLSREQQETLTVLPFPTPQDPALRDLFDKLSGSSCCKYITKVC